MRRASGRAAVRLAVASHPAHKARAKVRKANKWLIPPSVLSSRQANRHDTDGYFDAYHAGMFNPVGVVKGWAIYNASEMLRQAGIWDFYVDAGGDVQLSGRNGAGECWDVGIRNPFYTQQIVKVLKLSDMGIATSGMYVRGDHIYDPHSSGDVPGRRREPHGPCPNVWEADRYATTAFADYVA